MAVQIGVVSVWLYNEHAEEVEGKLDRDTPWGVAVAVAATKDMNVMTGLAVVVVASSIWPVAVVALRKMIIA